MFLNIDKLYKKCFVTAMFYIDLRPAFRFYLYFIFLSSSIWSEKLILSQHKTNIGGSAALSYRMDVQVRSTLNLNLQPSVGYFVYKNLELLGAIGLNVNLFTTNITGANNDNLHYNFGVGVKYYFNIIDNFFIYVGTQAMIEPI
jgi:hypothetical protein